MIPARAAIVGEGELLAHDYLYEGVRNQIAANHWGDRAGPIALQFYLLCSLGPGKTICTAANID